MVAESELMMLILTAEQVRQLAPPDALLKLNQMPLPPNPIFEDKDED